MKTFKSNLFMGGEELRELMTKNPELPVVFEANCGGETGWYVMEKVAVTMSEVLTIDGPVPDKAYCDREELEEDIEKAVFAEGTYDDTNEIYLEALERSKAYEPYWTKCILVSIGG